MGTKGSAGKGRKKPASMTKPAMMDWALRLLRLLNEKKVLTSRVVAEEFGVNIRTAQRYLLYLSDLPCVVVDEEKHTYTLTSDYVITDKILNASEMALVCALIDYATHIFGEEHSKFLLGLKNRIFRMKATRSYNECLYLGWLVKQLDPASRLSFVGYSYGTRIITGALHIAAGGSLSGSKATDAQPSAANRRARVVLMAAAAHNYWLLPGEFHSAAISQIDRMLILFNTNDVALKNYHLSEPNGDPRALGYTGLATHRLGSDAERVSQRDVRYEIGKTHDELKYYRSGRVINDLQRYALWGSVGN